MRITPCRPRWKSSMTDRERFNRQMSRKSVDRCFNMEFGYWRENFDLWDIFIDNGIKTNPEADIFFNFDKIHTIGGRLFTYPAVESRTLEIIGDKKRIINPDGLIAEVPVDGHDTIPHYIRSSVVTPADWDYFKKKHFDVQHPGRIVDIAALRAEHGDCAVRDYPLGVNTGSMIGRVRDLLTFEGLAYSIYDYPEMVEDMVETSCQLVEHFLDQVLPHFQFDYAAGWEDICFKNGPIVSVSFFRDIVTPRYKRIHQKLKAHNIDLWYTDCDGDVRPILPHLLEGGINCLFPFEVNGCAHPGELLDAYEGRLKIMGGFDKMALGKDKQAIDDYMKTLVKYVDRGGYIPFCDHRCPPNVTPENYLYYLDLKEKTFGMK